jgi:hypothetical protein
MRLVWIPAILILLGSTVFAGASGLEVTVHSGWSFLDAENRFDPCPTCKNLIHDTIVQSVNPSILFGFKGGYHINRAMEIEGGFAVAPGHKLSQENNLVCIPELPCDIFPVYVANTKAVAYQYDADFVYNLPGDHTIPFMAFGIGGVSTDTGTKTNHDFAFNFGGGVKFYFGNVGVRMEVNDHVIPDYFLNSKTEHDLQVQYGFVFRLH